ncbi:MAG: STAS domain-containing protein [Pseudonocardiaceae bacterium]
MTDGQDGTQGDAEVLEVTRTQRGTAVVLSVTGELDVLTGSLLRRALSESLSDPADEPVIVDLTQVTFMSSTGIAVLADANWEADQRSKPLRIVVDPTTQIMRVFYTTGIQDLLAHYPDLDSALGADQSAGREDVVQHQPTPPIGP